MPLKAPEPPRQAAETVQSTFRTFAANRTFRSPALRNATGPLSLSEPHEIFSLGLADLIAGRGLDAAKPAGWRYLVKDGEKVLASAETVLGTTGNEHIFSAFNEGRFVASTAEAIGTARALPEVAKGSFELRYLQVPALYVSALWLHNAGGTGDLLVPLAPSPLDAAPGVPVPAARLLEELASKAKTAPAVGPADRSGG
jgi:hypothetical protein